MNFPLPFSIETSNKDYILSKLYEEKRESYLLTISERAKIESPITIKLNAISDNLDFHLKIHLKKGASMTIIEDWSSDISAKYVEYTNDIFCDSNTTLKYIILNNVSDNTNLKIKRITNIQNDSKCHIYAYHFGSKTVTSHVLQKANGKSSEVKTDIITKLNKKQELNFNAEHIYYGKEGSGEITMKGVAEDQAILNFDGMVNITQTGDGSAGYLNQEILNLSKNTIVKAIPGLKIDNNNVKAGHSANIRNLNNEDLYYFGARGIEKDEAKKLLITGFMGVEIKKIEHLTSAYETIKKLI